MEDIGMKKQQQQQQRGTSHETWFIKHGILHT
jgi:hypothetical protein